MQTVVVEGYSDDLVNIQGVKGGDEFGCYSPDDSPVHATFNLGGKMRLWCIYDGCWSFAVGQVDEAIPLPDWPVRVRWPGGRGYSTRLEIDVPDDVKVFREGPE